MRRIVSRLAGNALYPVFCGRITDFGTWTLLLLAFHRLTWFTVFYSFHLYVFHHPCGYLLINLLSFDDIQPDFECNCVCIGSR